MDRIVGEDFVIRVTEDADLGLLFGWHSDPEVNRYWERRALTEQEISHKYLGGRAPDVRCFIIESPAAEPVGFIQYAILDKPDEFGIDMFLIPTARGRGLGPRVARHLALHLIATSGAKRVTVDPLVANEQAVRAWERAGFKHESEIESGDHGEPAVLMVFSEG